MSGSSLQGRTLTWHALGDPPGAWCYALDEEIIAELVWSPAHSGVQAEVGSEVWRVHFSGTLLVRGVLTAVASGKPQLVYAGSLRQGLVLCREGGRFVFGSHWDRSLGPWAGFDDADGTGVLQIRGRVGGGGWWSEIAIAPAGPQQGVIKRLLVLWGSLQLLRLRRRWLSLTGGAATAASVQRELGRLAVSVAS